MCVCAVMVCVEGAGGGLTLAQLRGDHFKHLEAEASVWRLGPRGPISALSSVAHLMDRAPVLSSMSSVA